MQDFETGWWCHLAAKNSKTGEGRTDCKCPKWQCQRQNGDNKVKWKHQRRSSNIEEGSATSEEEWQHQRRRSSARLLLSTDHHSHQDHSPEQAILSGIVTQGHAQGEESG